MLDKHNGHRKINFSTMDHINCYQGKNAEEMDRETHGFGQHVSLMSAIQHQLASFLFSQESLTLMSIIDNSHYISLSIDTNAFTYVQDIHNGKYKPNLDVYQHVIDDESLWKRTALTYITLGTRLDQSAMSGKWFIFWYNLDNDKHRSLTSNLAWLLFHRYK